MYAWSPFSTAIISKVWQSASRTLSDISNVVVPTSSSNQTLAISATLTVGGAVGQAWFVSIGCAPAAAGVNMNLADGVNSYLLLTSVAASATLANVLITSSVFFQLVNLSGLTTVKYSYNTVQFQ